MFNKNECRLLSAGNTFAADDQSKNCVYNFRF